MSFLVINNLEKRFGSVEVLKGIDISLPRGDFLVPWSDLREAESRHCSTLLLDWSP